MSNYNKTKMLNNKFVNRKINDVGKIEETELQYKKTACDKTGEDEIVDNKIFRNKTIK
jgi:hypothetical protein